MDATKNEVKKTGIGILIIVPAEQKFLLLFRDNKPEIRNPATWALLGGTMEDGETPTQTAERELEEELGIHSFLQEIGTRGSNTFFKILLPKMRLNEITLREGTGYALFSMDGLIALNTIEGKGGLGGAIRTVLMKHPEHLRTLVEGGEPLPTEVFTE